MNVILFMSIRYVNKIKSSVILYEIIYDEILPIKTKMILNCKFQCYKYLDVKKFNGIISMLRGVSNFLY